MENHKHVANDTNYLLSHTTTSMYRQSDQVLQERLGIGMSQFKLLQLLQDQSGVRQRFVANQLGQTEASISRQIKLLQEKGMLAVKANPKSKREHVIMLTPKGIKIAQAAEETLEEHSSPAYEKLTSKQQEQFNEALRILHAYFCEEGKPYSCSAPELYSRAASGYLSKDML